MQSDVTARPPNYGLKLSLAVVFALLAVGCVVAAVLTAGGFGFVVAGLGFAAVSAALAYVFYRTARPPQLRGVDLRAWPQEAVPGQAIDVAVDAGGGEPLQVGLVGAAVMRVRVGTDPSQISERREVFHDEWRDVAGAPAQRLRFVLPADAAESRSGGGTRVSWSIVARRSRRGRFDRQHVQPLVVRKHPGGTAPPAA